MRVKLTLSPNALFLATRMRKLRGIETPKDFEGPEFKNVLRYNPNFDGKFVWVSLEDGTNYYYPIGSVDRIAAYPD